VREGDEVSVFYDPMIAKVIAWDETREGAAAKLAEALAETQAAGVQTNAGFLVRALRHKDFVAGEIDTGFIERHRATLIPDREGVAPQILARAALFLVEERVAKSRGHDPWDAQDGFRLSGEARETVEFVVADKRVSVEIVHHRGSGVTIRIAGTEIPRAAHADAMRLRSGDVAVMQGGETWIIALHDPFAAADATGVASDRVVSPMPGKIVQVHVRAGEKVTRGQPLAVLEAMKMEHTLKAGSDAVVESVDVAPGEQVNEGAIIVRFEREQNAAA
jgi:3-methylcrotonyl-CoA carboxylase alpha subunit